MTASKAIGIPHEAAGCMCWEHEAMTASTSGASLTAEEQMMTEKREHILSGDCWCKPHIEHVTSPSQASPDERVRHYRMLWIDVMERLESLLERFDLAEDATTDDIINAAAAAARAEERGAILDKAKRWHADGTMTDDEYGAVCAAVIVVDAKAMTDADKARAEEIAHRFLARAALDAGGASDE